MSLDNEVVTSTVRGDLLRTAHAMDDARGNVAVILADLGPLIGRDIEVDVKSPDYEALDDDALAVYIADSAEAIATLVGGFVEVVGPKLKEPMFRLALNTIKGFIR